MPRSKIVIKTSLTNFSSLRIEHPHPKSPGGESQSSVDNEENLLQSIPELTRHFVLEGKIGEGTFAKVFRARLIQNPEKKFALKYLISTVRPGRIAEEMRYLRDLGGEDNVCGVEGCILSNGHVVMILPYFAHDKFQDYMIKMDTDQIRGYMRSLLKALARIHAKGIVHRDVKPSNFLYCYETGQSLLVDFGLAQEEKDLVNMKKKMEMQMNSIFGKTNNVTINMKENDKQPARIVTSTQVIGKPENKQIVMKKRTNNDFIERKSKKLKSADGSAVLIDSSVLNTPITPSNAAPGEVCKDPNDPEHRNNVFKTPTRTTIPRTPVKSSANTTVTFIPETPQKVVTKDSNNRPRMQAKRLMAAADTPKSRMQDPSLICECFCKPQICKICSRKADLTAPRAGTPGFRAPEVLLRSMEQTSAIDIWSAGVMFISLISGRYPFFRNAEDMVSMAEIITLLGSKRVVHAARRLKKAITLLPQKCPPQDLRHVCSSLRPTEHPLNNIPDSAFLLMDRLLDPNPTKRITAEEALRHDFFTSDREK